MATMARRLQLRAGVGERMLTSKLQVLNGTANRRTSLALRMLTGRVIEPLPTCLAAWRILAWAQLELDADDEPTALATFQQCAALDAEDPLAYVGQAIWYQQRHDNHAAIRQWVHAWELDPQSQAIRRALVKLTGELPESLLADAVALMRAHCEDEAVDLLRQLRRERFDSVVSLTLI